MWAVGAVGVLEERNACGRWVWGEGGKRACGGGGEGSGGGVRAVRDVRAVRAGGAGGHVGAAIVCKCGEGAVCAVGAARAVRVVGVARAEYGSIWGGCEEGMWAVGVVGTFLWVVNAVKAQNQAEQEGAPPDAEPGSRRIYNNLIFINRVLHGGDLERRREKRMKLSLPPPPLPAATAR